MFISVQCKLLFHDCMIAYIVITRPKPNLPNENPEEVVVVGCVPNPNPGEKKIQESMH